jgi:hypothetical protein
MKPQLPPPDPHEPFSSPPDAPPLDAPTVVFARDSADPDRDRIADVLLKVRPGLLVLFA